MKWLLEPVLLSSSCKITTFLLPQRFSCSFDHPSSKQEAGLTEFLVLGFEQEFDSLCITSLKEYHLLSSPLPFCGLEWEGGGLGSFAHKGKDSTLMPGKATEQIPGSHAAPGSPA